MNTQPAQPTQTQVSQPLSPPQDDLQQFRKSMELINTALKKAAKAGVYDIDESYLIKVASSNMEKLIEACENFKKQKEQAENTK